MSDKLKILPPAEEHVVLPFNNPNSVITEMHFVQLAIKNVMEISDMNLDKFFMPALNAILQHRRHLREQSLLSAIVPMSKYKNKPANDEDGA